MPSSGTLTRTGTTDEHWHGIADAPRQPSSVEAHLLRRDEPNRSLCGKQFPRWTKGEVRRHWLPIDHHPRGSQLHPCETCLRGALRGHA